MITVSEKAKQKILESMAGRETHGMALRLAIAGRGPFGFHYALGFVPVEEQSTDDTVVDLGELIVLIDAESAPKLKNSSLDYVEDSFNPGFKIDNPNPLWTDPIAQAVQETVDKKINPGIAAHGGFVLLLDVKDDVAYVQFGGGCHGCGMVSVTLKDGVEATILKEVPQIKKVLDTTDHAEGKNPYYRSDVGGSPPTS
ncbi:MAG: iron-sulfur cluster assembly accessory protein [Anaerolineales bacterium]|nr:iron-sulfur cluster assembly accessory protein [Anaerolineales bacterium]